MNDGAVGRLLVASLHQAIADLLPSRLEFYESWLNPATLREGRIGLASLAAALSFLRREGEVYGAVYDAAYDAAYDAIVSHAGQYTAEWSLAAMPSGRRALIRALPHAIRIRLVLRLWQRLVRNTSNGSRASVRLRQKRIDIRGSLFCDVRTVSAQPLCEFYAAALRRFLAGFGLDADITTEQCRAKGATHCMLAIVMRPDTRRAGAAS